MSLLFLFMLHSDVETGQRAEKKKQDWILCNECSRARATNNQATHNNDKRKNNIDAEEYDWLASAFMQWNFVQNKITYSWAWRGPARIHKYDLREFHKKKLSGRRRSRRTRDSAMKHHSAGPGRLSIVRTWVIGFQFIDQSVICWSDLCNLMRITNWCV